MSFLQEILGYKLNPICKFFRKFRYLYRHGREVTWIDSINGNKSFAHDAFE